MDSTTVRTQLPPVDIVNAKNVQKLVVGIPKVHVSSYIHISGRVCNNELGS